jgi:dienelactone hydrolase
MYNFPPEINHNYLYENTKQIFEFKKGVDLKRWQQDSRLKLKEILGFDREKVDLNIKIEYEKTDNELFKEIRYIFTSERFSDIPCHLLIPKSGKKTFPVVICIQGHGSEMAVSLGRYNNEEEKNKLKFDDYAIQAVKEGYAALAVELKGFGEREEIKPEKNRRGICYVPSMSSALLGRTMAGDRAWDITRAIDTLSSFREIDCSKISCMGHSGGGITTYYSACLDDRIKIAMVNCALCTFKKSLFDNGHCACNHIPGILKYFEFADLSGLILPNKLLFLSGDKDHVFPIDGALEAFQKIKNIYESQNLLKNLKFVECSGGHQFFYEEAWTSFKEISGW